MHQIVDSLLKEGLSVGGFSVSLYKGDVGERTAGFNREDKEGVNATSPAAAEPLRATGNGLISIFI